MLTLEEVIAKAREMAAGAPDKDPVALVRQRHTAMIAHSLAAGGFPVSEAEKVRLSLVPLVFQEANYDDIGWMLQNENLRQLSGFLALDHLVQSGGRSRAEASPPEFAAYVEAAFRAIRTRRQEQNR